MSAVSLINVLAVNLHSGPGWEGEGGNPLVFFIFIFLTVSWLWLVSGKLGSACLLCCSLCGFLRPLSLSLLSRLALTQRQFISFLPQVQLFVTAF